MKASHRFLAWSGIAAILFGALLISLCVPGFRGAGQFLLENPTVFSSLDPKALGGIILLGVINVSLLRWFLRKTGIGMNPIRSILAYGVSVGLGIIIFFGIHSVAIGIASLSGPALNSLPSSNNSSMQNGELNFARIANNEKPNVVSLGIVVIIMLLLLWFIGGGYACMDPHSPLLFQFIVSTLGVGIAEESSKLLVGLLAYRFFRPNSKTQVG